MIAFIVLVSAAVLALAGGAAAYIGTARPALWLGRVHKTGLVVYAFGFSAMMGAASVVVATNLRGLPKVLALVGIAFVWYVWFGKTETDVALAKQDARLRFVTRSTLGLEENEYLLRASVICSVVWLAGLFSAFIGFMVSPSGSLSWLS